MSGVNELRSCVSDEAGQRRQEASVEVLADAGGGGPNRSDGGEVRGHAAHVRVAARVADSSATSSGRACEDDEMDVGRVLQQLDRGQLPEPASGTVMAIVLFAAGLPASISISVRSGTKYHNILSSTSLLMT